jgi:hypothetical protein
MVKTKKRPKSDKQKRHGPDATAPTRSGGKKPSQNGLTIALTIAAVVVAVVIAVPLLTPVIVTAPIIKLLVEKTRTGDQRAVTSGVLRWVISVFATTLVVSAFVPERVSDSFPFAANASEHMISWLAGSASTPPASYGYLFAGMAAFLTACLLSVGILGSLLWSITLGTSAVAAASLYAAGYNIVQITVIALPPWQISLFASALFVLAPLASLSRRIVFRKCENDFEWQVWRRHALVAGSLFLLSILLRLTIAGPYLALARHWTIV